MKTSAHLITILAISAAALSANPEYENYIRQIQSDTYGTTHDLKDLVAAGRTFAKEGVKTSATFRLWTIHRSTGKEHLLDEKIVSSYHPEAEITITSKDPYKPVPRTRVDQPFTVEHKVDGLVFNDPNAPDAAKSVVLHHVATTYDAGNQSGTKGSSGGLIEELLGNVGQLLGNVLNFVFPQVEIQKNGTTTENRMTSIKADDLTTASGEETFAIFAKPDYGIEEASLLARAKVQVWPIARGSISGYDKEVAYASLPDLNVTLNDLYPASSTWIRAYKGGPTDNPQDPIIINTSYVIIEDVKPNNRDYILGGLDNFLTEAGSYTLEILHETPFGTDLLYQTDELVKKTGIKVVGQVNSSE